MRAERERAWWLAVVALAAAVRFGYVLALAPHRLPLADPLTYHLLANVLAGGHGFVNPLLFVFGGRSVPTASEPPLFPLLLAAGSVLGAQTVLWHQLMGAALGTMTVVLIGAIGRTIAGPRAGLWAAALAAVYPPLWLADAGVMAESLFAMIIAVVILAAYRFTKCTSLGAACALGVAIGAAALTRVEGALLLPLLALPLIARVGGGRRKKLAALGGATLAATAVLAPWVLRNLMTFDRPTLLSTGDGTVAGANCDATYRGSKVGLWAISCYGPAAPGDESDANAAWRRQGLSYAAHHLDRAPVVVVVRIARTWQVYGPLQDARINRDDGRPPWTNMLALAAYAVVVPLAVAGAFRLHRLRVPLVPLGAQIALVTVTAALVWGAIRFRAPADVAMVVLAGVAVAGLGPRRPVRSPTAD